MGSWKAGRRESDGSELSPSLEPRPKLAKTQDSRLDAPIPPCPCTPSPRRRRARPAAGAERSADGRGLQRGNRRRRRYGDHARAAGEPFDVIVLDVMLPGRDGFDVARTIRAAGHPDADPDADRAHAGRRSRRRPEARRRRLPDQAVRHDRAAGAHRGAAAPRAGEFAGVALERYQFGDIAGGRPQGRSDARRAAARAVGEGIPAAAATSSSTAAPRSRATSCCRRCGATARCRRRARWTCTWRGCGRSSSPTRACRSSS